MKQKLLKKLIGVVYVCIHDIGTVSVVGLIRYQKRLSRGALSMPEWG